jgi:glutamine amidotransferase
VKVAVLDHGMGNLRSVAKALEAAGAEVDITADRSIIERCDALCVPGQGIFGRCMESLAGGGADLIREWISSDRPYLGICLGMQVLFEVSEERGPLEGLGVLAGAVRLLPDTVTVPHIGWNVVDDTYYYFDHSYAAHPGDPSIVTGWARHGTDFAARVESGSVLAVQFHPEKSGADGIALLQKWTAA